MSRGFDELLAGLREQCASFGLLGYHHQIEVADLQWIDARLTPLREVIAYLDASQSGPLTSAELPLLYMTVGWPPAAPPGGWVDAAAPIPWLTWLDSIRAMWRLQLNLEYAEPVRRMQASRKFLRAALWVAHFAGVPRAIAYLFALADAGFVINSDAMVLALSQLLIARRHVADDSQLAELFQPGVPLTAPEWIAGPPLAAAVLAGRRRLRPDLDDDAELLIDLVEARIATAAAAGSEDEWIIARTRAGLAARHTHITLRLLDLADDLAFAGHAARYEEISADGGYPWGVTALAQAMLNDASDLDAAERIWRERISMPDARIAWCRAAFPAGTAPSLQALPRFVAPGPPNWPIVTALLMPVLERYATHDAQPSKQLQGPAPSTRLLKVVSPLAAAIEVGDDRLAASDLGAAFREARFAVLLEPQSPNSWELATRVLQAEGSSEDALSALAVAAVARGMAADTAGIDSRGT